MEDKLDVGVDYVISQSTGKIHITSATSEDFPDLEVDLETIKLYASYRMEDNMTLHAAYGYESYDTKNWALDNVNVDTLSDVLLFGEVTPSYNVSVITVSLRYKF
jgi:predicted porin